MFLPISPYTGRLQTLAGPTKENRLETADTQNVWLKLVDHLGRLRDPAALSGWPATTTQRECGRILHADTKGRADQHDRGRRARTLIPGASALVVRVLPHEAPVAASTTRWPATSPPGSAR